MATFGVTIFPTDYAISPLNLATAVEARGLDALFFNEHSHIPTSRKSPLPGGAELPKHYCHTYDPFVAFGAAAAVTQRIRLGTGICLVVERDPIQLAKEVASLDTLSNGRVMLGIGGGWNAEEMENHGTLFPQRWKILRERVLAMREIWTKETTEFHGEFVNFGPLWSWPKPVQEGGPKILLGSKAKRGLGRVVEYCDGWMPLGGPGVEMQLAEGVKEFAYPVRVRGPSFRVTGTGGDRPGTGEGHGAAPFGKRIYAPDFHPPAGRSGLRTPASGRLRQPGKAARLEKRVATLALARHQQR